MPNSCTDAMIRSAPRCIFCIRTFLIFLTPIYNLEWDLKTRPLAAPMIGGLITSTIHVLVVTPVLFSFMKERALKKGRLQASKMANWMK